MRAHDASTPLYLNYDSKVAHYPQQAPVEYQQKFSFITDSVNRMMYHSMVNYLDDNLANVTVRPSAVFGRDELFASGLSEACCRSRASSKPRGCGRTREPDCACTGRAWETADGELLSLRAG